NRNGASAAATPAPAKKRRKATTNNSRTSRDTGNIVPSPSAPEHVGMPVATTPTDQVPVVLAAPPVDRLRGQRQLLGVLTAFPDQRAEVLLGDLHRRVARALRRR